MLALITGVSRAAGIGTAIARALAAAGCDIFITYYRPYDQTISQLANDASEPELLLAELRALGRRAAGLELDLSDADAPRQLFDHVEATLGPVSILINNATFSIRDGVDHLTAEMLDQTYTVNVRAMALLSAEFVKRFKQQTSQQTLERHGRIINMSSGQSFGPMPGELAYAMSKGAVEAFTLSLSAEVMPFGITVNAIDPGITDTGWIPPALHAQWSANAPSGRVGLPNDAARLVKFLASAEAGWITGQLIRSRGGI